MTRTFHNPTNIIELNNIFNQAQQSQHTLYFSDRQGNTYIIRQVNFSKNIICGYVGTNPNNPLEITWNRFVRLKDYIWESDI